MSSGIARRGGAGGPALSHPVACGGDPSQCARQPPHPRRACTPPRAARARSPQPAELPRRPGGSSPGTLPLWGASFSPPPGPDPRELASLGQFSATCSGAGEPGRRQPVSRCERPEPHGAAGQQRQLRERCVGPVGAAGTRCTLRFAFPSRCSFLPRPLLPGDPKRGRGFALVPPPSSQARLGRSRLLAGFPPRWTWGAGRRGRGGSGRRRRGLIDWSWSIQRVEGRVSGLLLCIVALDISTCPGLSPWGSPEIGEWAQSPTTPKSISTF